MISANLSAKTMSTFLDSVRYIRETTCLAHCSLESVDDADVTSPSDGDRNIEVDDASSQDVGRVRLWVAKRSSPETSHVCPDEQRTVERRVVDPYSHNYGRSYLGFESRSTQPLESQKSTEQS